MRNPDLKTYSEFGCTPSELEWSVKCEDLEGVRMHLKRRVLRMATSEAAYTMGRHVGISESLKDFSKCAGFMAIDGAIVETTVVD